MASASSSRRRSASCVAPTLTTRSAVLGLVAIGLAVVGVVQTQHVLPRWVVPAAIIAASVAGTATGLRFHLIGVPAVDAAWTVAWLAGVTLAVAGLGNADGLTAGVVSAAGVGVMALAGFADQGGAATAAAALVGAALAFLAYNLRPASLYIGRAGGLFAGFSLAAGALWLEPAIAQPDALVVPLFIVGVALLDGMVVVASRLRHRRSLATRYRDHLAHRLVAVGLRPSQAISVLIAIQVVMTALAVFVGRGVLSLPIGAGAGVVVLGVLWIISMRATVSSEDAPGFSAKVWLTAFAVLLLLGAASAGAGYLAYQSRDDVTAGRDFARSALRAARKGEPKRAAALFAKAEDAFRSAQDKVDSPLATPGLLVPVVGANLNAARELSDIGAELARAGQALTASVDPDSLRIVDGRVPLEAVAAVEPKLTEAADLLVDSKARLDELNRTFLVDQIDEAIGKLEPELAKTTEDAVHGAAAARLAPKILGGDGPRHYFLAVQNPAELRGTGGLIGNWAILTAENGKVTVGDVTKLGALNYKEGDPDAGPARTRRLQAALRALPPRDRVAHGEHLARLPHGRQGGRRPLPAIRRHAGRRGHRGRPGRALGPAGPHRTRSSSRRGPTRSRRRTSSTSPCATRTPCSRRTAASARTSSGMSRTPSSTRRRRATSAVPRRSGRCSARLRTKATSRCSSRDPAKKAWCGSSTCRAACPRPPTTRSSPSR